MNSSPPPTFGSSSPDSRPRSCIEPHSLPATTVTLVGNASAFIRPEFPSTSWCLQPEGTQEICDLRPLKEGDRVTISDPGGKVLFDGIIHPVYSLVEPERIYIAINGHQQPGGFLSSWTQQGWCPAAWAGLFAGGTNRLQLVRQSAQNEAALPDAA